MKSGFTSTARSPERQERRRQRWAFALAVLVALVAYPVLLVVVQVLMVMILAVVLNPFTSHAEPSPLSNNMQTVFIVIAPLVLTLMLARFVYRRFNI